MLIKGITLFLYLWVAALLYHKDVGLIFSLGEYRATGGLVLLSMLGFTFFCWGVTYWVGPPRRWLTVLNLFVGGATLGGLASLLLGITQWTNRRDYLYYRPWSHVQITYPEGVHCRVWQETFLQTLGGVAPPEGATPAVGATLRETTRLAREAALTYLDELARSACTSPPPQPTSYSWFYIGLGVVVGLVLLGGLLIYLNTPPPPPGSPPPPGGPPSSETPPWWTKPEAAEVKPVVSSPKWKPEDYDELIALVSGNSATDASSSSPSSSPEGEFGLDEVISYFESLPPAPVRPRSPSKFTIEDVEALFERAPRAARAAPGTTTADVLAAPRPRGVEGLITRASAVRGPRPAPPVRTPREAAELYLDQNYSSVSSTPLTAAARAELVSAMASAVTGMAEFAAELHGGRTIVNPPTEEVPPRRSRPAGVFTPLSAFPDLPPPPPRRTRAEELYGPDSGIWDYVAEIEANSRRNFPPAGDSGKTPK